MTIDVTEPQAVKWVIQDPRNTNGDRSLNSNWSYLSLVYSEGRESVVLILHYQTKACFFFSLFRDIGQ